MVENAETQIYDDEQIKRLAAFFAEDSYKSLIGESHQIPHQKFCKFHVYFSFY